MATSFNASNLLGFKSWASILEETSTAITISIPLLFLVCVEISIICGLAKAIIKETKAVYLNKSKKGKIVVFRDDLLNESIEDMLSLGFLRCLIL